MQVGKIDFLKESMYNYYAPATAANIEATNSQQFMQTMQKKSDTQQRDVVDMGFNNDPNARTQTSPLDRGDHHYRNRLEQKDDKPRILDPGNNDKAERTERAEKADRAERAERAEKKDLENEPSKNPANKTDNQITDKNQPNGNEPNDGSDKDVKDKNVKSDQTKPDNQGNNENNEKNENNSRTEEAGKNQKTNQTNGETSQTNTTKNSPQGEIFKEVLNKRLENSEQMDNAKTELKEKVAENQNISAKAKLGKNVQAGKEAQNTADQNNTDQNNTDQNNNNPHPDLEKANESIPNFKSTTVASDADIEKAAEKTSFKSELKTKSAVNTSDPNQVNAPHLESKHTPQATEIKVEKTTPPSNLAAQYEIYKEKIVNAVENSIRFLVTEGEKKVNISLQPPELGRVEVELLVKDSQVTATINAENAAVKEVIMSNLDQLKTNLENAGIGVNKFDVEVGGFKNQFDRQFSNDNSNGGKGNGREKGDGQIPLQDKDWLPDKVIKQRALNFMLGGSVNYLV